MVSTQVVNDKGDYRLSAWYRIRVGLLSIVAILNEIIVANAIVVGD
jgi:hypothetical protein